jgi:next-to-BRCA1 protein 1
MQEPVVPEEHPASCDLCHKRIRGIRTKCTNCPDWDCCETCLPKLGNRHPGHTLVKINLASDLVEPPFRHQKVKHTNIICDMCQGTVVGDRWKCVHPDCNDYDLCDNCHASPLNTHPREHPILKLSVPTNIDYASRFLRNGAKIGDHLPRRYCDFGHREPYTPLTEEEREELKTRWTCKHHSTFELCEKSRIYHASKGALEKSSEGTQPEAGPSNSVDIDQTLRSKASTDTDQPLESKPPTDMDEFAPGSHPDLIKCYEFPPAFAICPAKYEEDRCITPTIDSSLDTAAVDEFAPGSHPDIIKCYIYPPSFEICPAKYEEDRCITPTIDPSLDTETPTINPSIETESPTNSPVADITTPSNDSIFTGVKDLTIPAGCSLPVGAEFTKTWSMEHLVSGHEYKFDQLRLVHESGGLLGEACNIQLAFTQDEIKTGEKVEVSIAGLKVPDLPEQQVVEQWRFRDVDGTAYGEPLRLRYVLTLLYLNGHN